MHIVSLGTPVARSFAQKLYLVVAGLIFFGLVSEGLLIGPSLFADMHWGRAIHGDLGVLLVQGWQLMKVQL